VPTQEFTPPPEGTDERDALDDALVDEAPPAAAPSEEAPSEDPVSEVYDFATDEEPFGEGRAAPAPAESDDFEALGPLTDEPAEEEPSEEFESEGYTDEQGTVERARDDTSDFVLARDPDSDEFDAPAAVPVTDEHDAEDDEGEDILAGSPEFVEDGEDEDLWFEKGPPKDFDFEEDED
jgi:hypothetical protein